MIQTTATPDEYKRGAERMASYWDEWAKSKGAETPGSAEEGARGAGPLMSAPADGRPFGPIERISLWLSSASA